MRNVSPRTEKPTAPFNWRRSVTTSPRRLTRPTRLRGHPPPWPPASVATGLRGHRPAWSPACVVTGLRGHRPAWSPACVATRLRGHRPLRPPASVATRLCGHPPLRPPASVATRLRVPVAWPAVHPRSCPHRLITPRSRTIPPKPGIRPCISGEESPRPRMSGEEWCGQPVSWCQRVRRVYGRRLHLGSETSCRRRGPCAAPSGVLPHDRYDEPCLV
jgi:hypothetical protein